MAVVIEGGMSSCRLCGCAVFRSSVEAHSYKICDGCYQSYLPKITELIKGFLKTRKLTFKEKFKLSCIEQIAYERYTFSLKTRKEQFDGYLSQKKLDAKIAAVKPRKPRRMAFILKPWEWKKLNRFELIRKNAK